MGGALADAVTCNAVVKAFGAEAARLARVVDKWRRRTRRTWMRGTLNAGVQGAMLALMQVAMIGASLWLWARGQASVGDITFALTMFFHAAGLSARSGHGHPQPATLDQRHGGTGDAGTPALGVADKPGAGAIRITEGEIRFDDVTFRYGAHDTPLYEHSRRASRRASAVGLVGHSGSGKTTFIKLIQRLYDVNEGRILIDGQDIAQAQQASLRRQIAIVQQEPILFHRTLAENIAYGRPGATQAEIEHAARRRPARTTSSCACPRAMTRWWASAA